MFAIFPNQKVINLSQVTLIEPTTEKNQVQFRFADGSAAVMEMDEVQFRALLTSLQHHDAVHHVVPAQKGDPKSKLDFRDFPSVLEGENSPA